MPVKAWKSTTLTAEEIGVTSVFLRDNRLNLFRAGHHYKVVNPTAHRPTYKWHVKRCDDLLKNAAKKAAKRETDQNKLMKRRKYRWVIAEDIEPYDLW
ncbi:MAG: hypothetical protein AAGL08_13865 [Cyanobacteria bacterium J06573_11]